MIMDDNTNVTFEQIGEFEYKVMDDEGNRFFIGELDDALDTYSAWTEGKEPPFELDYTVDLENVEIIIEFEDDED